MVTISVEEQNFKDMLKQALLELFEERHDLFRDLMAETLEDAGLSAAIQEGMATPNVSRNEVFGILAGGA
jgi:hypothetical protein